LALIPKRHLNLYNYKLVRNGLINY